MSARLHFPLALGLFALLASGTQPAAAQEEHEHDEGMHEMHMARMGSVVTDLQSDLEEVRGKLMGLARAIPAGTYDWRPAEGVRSVSEVFRHVAADNFFLPAALGVPAPDFTGIQADSYASVQAFEGRDMDREQVLEVLQASFDHVAEHLAAADPAMLGETVQMFGQEYTRQRVWILAVTHMHEHLGQMIAYARTNGVVPPWSR